VLPLPWGLVLASGAPVKNVMGLCFLITGNGKEQA